MSPPCWLATRGCCCRNSVRRAGASFPVKALGTGLFPEGQLGLHSLDGAPQGTRSQRLSKAIHVPCGHRRTTADKRRTPESGLWGRATQQAVCPGAQESEKAGLGRGQDVSRRTVSKCPDSRWEICKSHLGGGGAVERSKVSEDLQQKERALHSFQEGVGPGHESTAFPDVLERAECSLCDPSTFRWTEDKGYCSLRTQTAR